MKDFLKDRWVLLLVLCVFVVFKIPHLSYAYYWDESTPYAKAIKAMHDHGISFLPNAIDADLSRGHPLFFHVAAASWMKIFGGSHIAMHSFSLLISILFLVAIFEVGRSVFNVKVAVMTLLLLAIQEVFIVQSSFVLMEVLVALLCFAGLYFYVRGRYMLTACTLTLLFFTKESGLILGFVLGLDALYSFFEKGVTRRVALVRLLSVVAPTALILGFFVVQKQMLGWYIFPEHAGLIEHSWNSFWYKFRMVSVSDFFYTRSKYYYFLVVLIIAVVAAIKNRKVWYIVLFIPAYFIFYFVDDMRAGRILPSVPFFILFVVGWFYTLWVLHRASGYSGKIGGRFIVLAGSFGLFYLCFCGMNFFTPRYLIACMAPMFMLIAAVCELYIRNSYKALYYVVLVAFTSISFYITSNNDNFGDADLGAFKAMDVQQKVVDYLENKNYYDKYITTGANLEIAHLADPASGYLRKGRKFNHVRWLIDDSTEFIVFDNIEPDYRYQNKHEWRDFELEWKYTNGKIWAEVYRRKKQ